MGPSFWQVAEPVAGFVAGAGFGLALAFLAVCGVIFLVRAFLS